MNEYVWRAANDLVGAIAFNESDSAIRQRAQSLVAELGGTYSVADMSASTVGLYLAALAIRKAAEQP